MKIKQKPLLYDQSAGHADEQDTIKIEHKP